MVIGLSPTLTERDGLAVDEGEPMDDSLEAGLKFGEWFISALNEYILL